MAKRDGRFAAGGAEVVDGGNAAQYVREQHVDTVQTTSEPRMPTGMSRFGFLVFLRGRRDRVEPDEGEEHDARTAENAQNAAVVVRHAFGRHIGRRRWNERRVIRRIDEPPAEHDHHHHDRHLRDDDQLLTSADSRVPRISSADNNARMTTAGMFMIPWTPLPRFQRVNGAIGTGSPGPDNRAHD